MKAEDLKIGQQFKYKNKLHFVITTCDTFIKCVTVPYSGETIYLYRHLSVEYQIEDEYFKSNPDHKKNMF